MTTTWGCGDYPAMARLLDPVARAVVDQAGVEAGQDVLDIACGDGNAALHAAGRGARVTGVDYEPALLAAAARRADLDSRDISWLRSDVEDLPVPEASCDVVMSVVGVMYARDHPAAASEIARVLRPRGRAVLAAWTPGSFMPSIGRVFGPYVPPVTGEPPSRWADESSVSELLRRVRLRVLDFRPATLDLRWPDAARAADFLIRTAGHVVSERELLLDQGRWDLVRDEVAQFVRDWSGPGDDVRISMEYAMLTAVHDAPR